MKLSERIETVAKLAGGRERIKEIGDLSNPSERYWTWESEIELAYFLHSKGVGVAFSDNTGGPDLKLTYEGLEIHCEVTAPLKQELGFFELKQLLDQVFQGEYLFTWHRKKFDKLPKMSPKAVWQYFQEIRAALRGDPNRWKRAFFFTDEGGVPFEVIANSPKQPAGYHVRPYDYGDPRETLRVRICEVLRRKAKQLCTCRPNILAICLIQDEQLKRVCDELRGNFMLDCFGHADGIAIFDNFGKHHCMADLWVAHGVHGSNLHKLAEVLSLQKLK
jgi:hypothetical protein